MNQEESIRQRDMYFIRAFEQEYATIFTQLVSMKGDLQSHLKDTKTRKLVVAGMNDILLAYGEMGHGLADLTAGVAMHGTDDSGLAAVVNQVFSKHYDAHIAVEVQNPKLIEQSYSRLHRLIGHYQDMSIWVDYAHHNGQGHIVVFDAMHEDYWKELEIKPGDTIELHAHDLKGDTKKAERALHNIARHLGDTEPHDRYAGFIQRRLLIDNPDGMTPPITILITQFLKEKYKGDVYLFYDQEQQEQARLGKPLRIKEDISKHKWNIAIAKSPMGVNLLQIPGKNKNPDGTYVVFLYEPRKGNVGETQEDLEKLFNSIKDDPKSARRLSGTTAWNRQAMIAMSRF
jgi:hypothetical protein